MLLSHASVIFDIRRLRHERGRYVPRARVNENSVRVTRRSTGTVKGTVPPTLEGAGAASLGYQHRTPRDHRCRCLQCGEIRSFCHSKQKGMLEEHAGKFCCGDVWHWTAIDTETKRVPSIVVSARDKYSANAFMCDMAGRLRGRVLLTEEGYEP